MSVQKPSRYSPDTAQPFLKQANDARAKPWQAAAFAQLVARGLPTPKLERWKYTNLAGFAQSGANLAKKTTLGTNPVALPWMFQNSRKLVFVNGFLALGDARITQAGQGMDAASDTAPMDMFADGMMWALNTALAADGPQISATEDGALFEIMYLGQWADDKLLASPRGTIDVAANIGVTIVEQFLPVGAGQVHTNAGLEINVAAGAKLTHIRVQDEGRDRTVISTTHARVARDATYDSVFLNLGAGLSRQEIWVELDEAGARATINGAQLLSGRQHMDTTVLIEHKAPHCSSSQIIRNVLDGEAVGVFQGKIHVHQVAQKTDGYQLCNTLMLSDRAQMNTKPELEIYADDVKCSHGTTTGKIDDAPLFYLRSRGIPEAEARRMMLTAFIGDLYSDLPENVQTALMQQVEGWLDHAAPKES